MADEMMAAPQDTMGAPPTMMAGPGAGPTGPAAVASPNRGLEAQALIDMSLALKLLKRAFVRLPDGSKEQAETLKAMTGLTKFFGPAEEGLEKSEIVALSATQPNAQTPGPQQGQAFAQMIRSMNEGRGIGAGAPPPQPQQPAPAPAPVPGGG